MDDSHDGVGFQAAPTCTAINKGRILVDVGISVPGSQANGPGAGIHEKFRLKS